MNIKCTDNSDQVKAEMQAAVERALEKCGLVAEGYAKRLCPVEAGNLRNSITHATAGRPGQTLKYTKEMQESGAQPSKMQITSDAENTVYIGSAVFYAPYVELGTGKYYPGGRPTPWKYQDAKGNWHWTHGNPAKPFLKPAVADHKQTYRKIIEGEMNG